MDVLPALPALTFNTDNDDMADFDAQALAAGAKHFVPPPPEVPPGGWPGKTPSASSEQSKGAGKGKRRIMQFSTMPCQCPPECDVAGCPTPDEHFRKWCGICETYHRDLGPKSKFCCTCTGEVKGAEKDAKSNGESAEF